MRLIPERLSRIEPKTSSAVSLRHDWSLESGVDCLHLVIDLRLCGYSNPDKPANNCDGLVPMIADATISCASCQIYESASSPRHSGAFCLKPSILFSNFSLDLSFTYFAQTHLSHNTTATCPSLGVAYLWPRPLQPCCRALFAVLRFQAKILSFSRFSGTSQNTILSLMQSMVSELLREDDRVI